jgi:hypothetical protein
VRHKLQPPSEETCHVCAPDGFEAQPVDGGVRAIIGFDEFEQPTGNQAPGCPGRRRAGDVGGFGEVAASGGIVATKADREPCVGEQQRPIGRTRLACPPLLLDRGVDESLHLLGIHTPMRQRPSPCQVPAPPQPPFGGLPSALPSQNPVPDTGGVARVGHRVNKLILASAVVAEAQSQRAEDLRPPRRCGWHKCRRCHRRQAAGGWVRRIPASASGDRPASCRSGAQMLACDGVGPVKCLEECLPYRPTPRWCSPFSRFSRSSLARPWRSLAHPYRSGRRRLVGGYARLQAIWCRTPRARAHNHDSGEFVPLFPSRAGLVSGQRGGESGGLRP